MSVVLILGKSGRFYFIFSKAGRFELGIDQERAMCLAVGIDNRLSQARPAQSVLICVILESGQADFLY